MFIGFTPSKTIESLQVEELQRNGKKNKTHTLTHKGSMSQLSKMLAILQCLAVGVLKLDIDAHITTRNGDRRTTYPFRILSRLST